MPAAAFLRLIPWCQDMKFCPRYWFCTMTRVAIA